MKTQLIKTQDKFILVSDEEIKEGDWYCFPLYNGGYCIKQYNSEQHFNEEPCISLANLKAKKIIAGIPELSSIDFSLLSEEDCKRIGWVNYRAIAASFILSNSDINKALYLLDNAKITIPEEIIVWEKFEYEPLENIISIIDDLEILIKTAQSLNDKWNVEVEMENYIGENNGTGTKWHPNYDITSIPKITNNSIKITKIL